MTRLLRIGTAGAERPAVMTGDGLVTDVSDLVADFDAAFWAQGGPAWLREELDRRPRRPVPLEGGRIGACIPRPGHVLCIGLNYRDHALEAGMPVPEEPIVFTKAPSAVCGPFDALHLPPGRTSVDWEVELGVVIGRRALYLDSPDDAWDFIGGLCVSDDVSERRWQLERGGQWVKGKSFPTFNPVGPYLVPLEDIDDLGSLRLRTTVNGDVVQDGTVADMVFDVAHLVWYLSQTMMLEPGDLINTGTPAGVGMGMNPQRFLSEGDVIEVAIDGLGGQRQTCRRWNASMTPGGHGCQ